MSTNTYKKKYKCPYCEERLVRQKLIIHVENDHEDMIPKGYTSSRIVYNSINRKDHGICMICHKETKWDENKQRYNSLCGNPKCKKEYIEIVRSRMVKKYGTYNLLTSPEFQKKMLEGRSISGKYKFEDGGSVGYVGSYEKKFLEFMDRFLHIKSYDIMSPGPNIPYMYKGKEHIWITDFLYVPYNLVFDIKDGGDNPNTRDMKEYREKQLAKEKAIAEYGEYNYIRLTDNKFEQLILMMMELKDNPDITKNPIIKINESYIEESNKIKYTYSKLEGSKDIDNFYKCMKKVLDPEFTMNEAKKISKSMKMIKCDNKIIGYIGFSYYNEDNRKYLGIGNFIIMPEYQRMGYGSSVIDDIIKKNKSKYDEIYCYVDESNVKAIKFYKKIADVNTNNLSKYGYYVCLYKKSSAIDESNIKESNTQHLYHLSKGNLDGKTLTPRIPSNFLVNNGYEDKKIKRVCFSTSIDGSLMGMSQNLSGLKFYVHVPDGDYSTYKPSIKEVPDSKITNEIWIKEPVKLKCIGIIEVIGDDGKDGIQYKYGNNIAELYGWNWKWIKKINESYIQEETRIEDDKIPSDILNLSKRLNSYKYGYISKNNNKIYSDMDNFFDNYESLSISKFENYKCGICWDYVHYEANWFKSHGYKYKTYYIHVNDKNNNYPSHTYLVFYLPNTDGVYYFESSWKNFKGIEKFNNINELNDTIKKRHIDSVKNPVPSTFYRTKYNAESKSLDGLSCADYIKKLSKIDYSSESFMQEETRIEDDKIPEYIYHISTVNHNGETFEPRVYDNDNVKKNMERRVKRVCFSDSIEGALYSIFPNGAYDIDLYIHVPGNKVKVYSTTTDDIYDSDITHELWVKEPVEMKCIGKIHVSGVSKKYHTIEVDKDKSGYGKRKYYEPRWNWVEKYEDKSSIRVNESN